jgi:hypothetical protein
MNQFMANDIALVFRAKREETLIQSKVCNLAVSARDISFCFLSWLLADLIDYLPVLKP